MMFLFYRVTCKRNVKARPADCYLGLYQPITAVYDPSVVEKEHVSDVRLQPKWQS
jgi:hypothetical protein